MAYGGPFPACGENWTTRWRDYQYQCYQESLSEEEEEEMSNDATLKVLSAAGQEGCKFCEDGVCTALACYDSSTRCGCRSKNGYPNYE